MLKDNLFGKLVEAGILPEESEGVIEVQTEEAVETAAEDVDLRSDSVMIYDPRISLKLKEIDFLIKK